LKTIIILFIRLRVAAGADDEKTIAEILKAIRPVKIPRNETSGRTRKYFASVIIGRGIPKRPSNIDGLSGFVAFITIVSCRRLIARYFRIFTYGLFFEYYYSGRKRRAKLRTGRSFINRIDK